MVWLQFTPKIQFSVSLLSGLGSIGYGIFWLLAGSLAPGMGSTGAAKDAVGFLAQISGGSFFISGAILFGFMIYKFLLSPPNKT